MPIKEVNGLQVRIDIPGEDYLIVESEKKSLNALILY